MYGPFASWGEVLFDRPLAAMRDGEREYEMAEAERPADGERGIYVLRHVDAAGRAEAGVEHVRLRRVGEAPVSVVRGPVWPSGAGWSPMQAGEGWTIHACWAGRFGAIGLERVELIEQVWGETERVAASETADGAAWWVRWERTPDGEPVRFRVRGVAADGGYAESGWSAWVTPRRKEAIAMEAMV